MGYQQVGIRCQEVVYAYQPITEIGSVRSHLGLQLTLKVFPVRPLG